MTHETVKEKLEYIGIRAQELYSALFDRGMAGQDVKHISHIFGDILSNTNELYDCCAQDIFDKFIASTWTGKKNPNVYFPFLLEDLKNGPLSSLVSINPDLYTYLENLAAMSAADELIPGTCIKASFPHTARKLVNHKKHADVIEIDRGPDEILIDTGNMRFSMSVQQGGFVLDKKSIPDKNTAIVKSYVLKDTMEPIADICVRAETSTKIIINKIYTFL